MLAGRPTLRLREGEERTLEPGEVLPFSLDLSAHQILNRSDAAARVLAVITSSGLRLFADELPVVAP